MVVAKHSDLAWLLHPLAGDDSLAIARAIQERDPSIIPRLEIIADQATDYYNDAEEREGPQALAHLGTFQKGMGEYYLDLSRSSVDPQAKKTYWDRTLTHLHDAWNAFISPSARGHDIDAHKLVGDFPMLLGIKEIFEYYQKNPETAKLYSIDIPTPGGHPM